MKIIEQGNLPGNKPYTVRCSKCNTLLEFLQSEAEYVQDQRDGDALKIKCPLCRNEIWKAV